MFLGAFEIFGTEHLIALALTFGVPLALIAVARRTGGAAVIAAAFAALLIANKAVVLWLAGRADRLSWENALPMHLCDWATVTVVVALLWRNQRMFELAYFWGLAGTLQAVLTPDLPFGFSDPGAWTFFISHSGVIAAVIFALGAFKLRVWPRSIVRAFAWSQVYLVAAAAVNWLLGVNYGYLCDKPSQASLMDHLGPWPWYILSLEVLAIVSYLLYYAPFFFADWFRSRAWKSEPGPVN